VGTFGVQLLLECWQKAKKSQPTRTINGVVNRFLSALDRKFLDSQCVFQAVLRRNKPML
jgi:hypothetical protein